MLPRSRPCLLALSSLFSGLVAPARSHPTACGAAGGCLASLPCAACFCGEGSCGQCAVCLICAQARPKVVYHCKIFAEMRLLRNNSHES